MIQFEPGNVVQLKSGGPTMTVEQQAIDMLGQLKVWVAWFDEKNQLKRATFAPDTLKLAEGGEKENPQ